MLRPKELMKKYQIGKQVELIGRIADLEDRMDSSCFKSIGITDEEVRNNMHFAIVTGCTYVWSVMADGKKIRIPVLCVRQGYMNKEIYVMDGHVVQDDARVVELDFPKFRLVAKRTDRMKKQMKRFASDDSNRDPKTGRFLV